MLSDLFAATVIYYNRSSTVCQQLFSFIFLFLLKHLPFSQAVSSMIPDPIQNVNNFFEFFQKLLQYFKACKKSAVTRHFQPVKTDFYKTYITILLLLFWLHRYYHITCISRTSIFSCSSCCCSCLYRCR